VSDDRWRLGRAEGVPATGRTDLLADPVAKALAGWDRAGEAGVIEIDPGLADTATLSQAYDLPLEASGNCVVVMGRRDGEERFAACVVRADTRADVNNLVKRTLDVRKCSFLAMERTTQESGMEHGGITPLGLPSHWRVLVDAALLEQPLVVLGAGVRRAKLLVPGPVLADLPGAEVVEGLGR
jgi:prolyl-tRNA editing enzyme YbaK/EbsC (Cys-tRNA(Pro) deacylase)